MIDIAAQLDAIDREVTRHHGPEGDDRTTLELEHTVPIDMAQSGAGSLYVGPGWDGGFVALDLYLRGEMSDDPVAAANSPEGRELSKQSVDS